MTTVKFQLEPLTCPSCIKKIEGKVGKIDGVEEVKVLFNSSKVKASYNEEKVSSEELKKVIENLGYPVVA
ncbi:copper ion binding protein [Planomicrobium stackebrandtii]|uniref:Copper ion binding protein n=1 Tax=Planomicrobium stackebrandtii TaxID=253160 RepID=A0ABU0GPD0_9BACL|nr:heavy-metal-associated domain-containing protein [Planomicrobium stackebrandtii]MDQ0427211.1 copper ion binding protein [Planomicrobium stackebrandtii]